MLTTGGFAPKRGVAQKWPINEEWIKLEAGYVFSSSVVHLWSHKVTDEVASTLIVNPCDQERVRGDG